jgi:hypothetical protein
MRAAALLGAGLCLAFAAPAAAADSIELAPPADPVAGVETTIGVTVTTDRSEARLYAALRPAADRSCAAGPQAEADAAGAEATLVSVTFGGRVGITVPFTFPAGGPWRLCAYTFDETTQELYASGAADVAVSAAPANVARPRVRRRHGALRCAHGSWTGTPAPHFAYAWRRGGKLVKGAHGRRLSLTARDEGRRFMCAVTAANVAGSATARSRPFTA